MPDCYLNNLNDVRQNGEKMAATLIDDLKFLGAEFKREFSDLGITPVMAEQHQQRIAEMRRSTVAGKLSRVFCKSGTGY